MLWGLRKPDKVSAIYCSVSVTPVIDNKTHTQFIIYLNKFPSDCIIIYTLNQGVLYTYTSLYKIQNVSGFNDAEHLDKREN